MNRQDYRKPGAAQESYSHPGTMTLTFLEWISPFLEHRGLCDLDPLTMRMAANWPNKEDYSAEHRFGA
jgi:hypothetical protein